MYSSSVYSFHAFLISPVSTRSPLFLSFIVPIFGQDVLLISLIFLKNSLVFPLITEEIKKRQKEYIEELYKKILVN